MNTSSEEMYSRMRKWKLIMSARCVFFFFSSRRRHTRCSRDWSSDVCSSDLISFAQSRFAGRAEQAAAAEAVALILRTGRSLETAKRDCAKLIDLDTTSHAPY